MDRYIRDKRQPMHDQIWEWSPSANSPPVSSASNLPPSHSTRRRPAFLLYLRYVTHEVDYSPPQALRGGFR